MKNAFTLAEVLITLGIIGIVAAMTMPALIQKNNNKVVETRLKKFYSSINQAILRAEADYGDKKVWFEDLTGASLDEDGKPIEGSSEAEKWFKKYLAPYMNISHYETLSNGALIIYFPDGSALSPEAHTTRDWIFYPGNPKRCIENHKTRQKGEGICSFEFNFMPTDKSASWKYHYNKGMEPFKYIWDGTKASLYTGMDYSCNPASNVPSYCTALIQMNNWTIPDDYPFKVSY